MRDRRIDFSRVLSTAHIEELPNPYYGKVRDCYDLPTGERILISSDRISAFDRILASIPFKGQVLTQTAKFWFEATADICPSHVLSYPDPNVVVGRHLEILPVEIVVRGYIAGNTSTSLLTHYRQGQRQIYGYHFADGLRDNQALLQPVITPTIKAFDGGHDTPLTAKEIVDTGLLDSDQWEMVSSYAISLFARGQSMAAERGLILVDTKYEFGVDEEGQIWIADEIHTPDSSRYWLKDGYEAAFEGGMRPPSFDKDVIRSWVGQRCDPYKDNLPEVPPEMIAKTAHVYIDAYEMITGQAFIPDTSGTTPLERVKANLTPWF